MASILAGTFPDYDPAHRMMRTLRSVGIPRERLRLLRVQPQGAMSRAPLPPIDAAAAERRSGILLAIHVTTHGERSAALHAFRAYCAMDVEEAEGEWRGRDWVDFDPARAPQLVDPMAAP